MKSEQTENRQNPVRTEMSRIDRIIEDIRRNTGIRRMRTAVLDNPEMAVQCFARIADAMLEWRGRKFDLGAVRDEVLMLVNWTYLLDDSLDYTKGILFKGHTGAGKTFLMKVWIEFLKIDSIGFQSNGKVYRMSPVMANARTIASEYAESDASGSDVIRRYSRIPFLILDDIGAEPMSSSSFGNKTSVISEIIDRRNEAALLTCGTSNLNKMAGENGYDDRTARRMGELFNVKAVRGIKK